MKKNRWLIGLGLLIAVTPFLGFPLAFKNLLSVIFGISIVYLAFNLKESKSKQKFGEDIFMDSKKTESNDSEFSVTYDVADGNTQKLLDDQENQQF